MADIFDIVADATRRDILRVVREASVDQNGESGEISVSQIVTALELSQPTVSKHLKVLRDSGLVRVREKGQHRYYRLDPEPLEAIEDWLFPFVSIGFGAEAEPFGAALANETREFASSVGKVFADTSHRVTSAALRVTGKKRRGH